MFFEEPAAWIPPGPDAVNDEPAPIFVPPVALTRPTPLGPLYAGFMTLQVADVLTTLRALDRGAVEGNPVMGGVVNNRAAFVAVKVGMTAGTLWLSEKLWKKNRTAAVVMLVAFNAAYATVVAHNARVISQLR